MTNDSAEAGEYRAATGQAPFDKTCQKCGMEFDTAVAVDGGLTFQADAQVCVYETPNGAWAFFHEYGGGSRGRHSHE